MDMIYKALVICSGQYEGHKYTWNIIRHITLVRMSNVYTISHEVQRYCIVT